MDEAEPFLRRAIKIREAQPGSPRDLAISRLMLAAMLVDSRRNVEALAMILSAVRGQVGQPGMEVGIKAVTLFQQGVVYKNMKMNAPAERSLRASLEASTALLGEGHPYNAFALFTLAGVQDELGRPDEAEAYYRRCLDICRNVAGMAIPGSSTSSRNSPPSSRSGASGPRPWDSTTRWSRDDGGGSRPVTS